MEKSYTCIICPQSCKLRLTDEEGEIAVTGQGCKRGEAYAISEYRDPRRLLTTTIPLEGAPIRRMPVVTTGEIPKALFFEALAQIRSIRCAAPIGENTVLLAGICGTEVDVIATCSIGV